MYYTGRDMKLSHDGMGISESDWSLFTGHVAALDHLALAPGAPSLPGCQSPHRRPAGHGKRGRAALALVSHSPINSYVLLNRVGYVSVLLGHRD
jgi:hypothetical protein